MYLHVQGELAGKLSCVGCGTRIGKYSWRGMQDARQKWIVPAFMIQRARVDACPLQPLPGLNAATPSASIGVQQRRTFASFS